MSDLLKKIEQDALRLTLQERAFLADRLLSSLAGDTLDDINEAWVIEAERRYTEYGSGKRKGVPARDVFQAAEHILK